MNDQTTVSAQEAQRAAALVLAELLTKPLPAATWKIYTRRAASLPDLDGHVPSGARCREDLRPWASFFGVPVAEDRAGGGTLRGYVHARQAGVAVRVWAEIEPPGVTR